MTEWYLWEKTPGRLGILPITRRSEHATTYVASFTGELSEAIRFAEDLERTGYSIVYETGFMPPPEPPEEKTIPTEPPKTVNVPAPAVMTSENSIPEKESRNDKSKTQDIFIADDPKPDPEIPSFMLPLEDFTEDSSEKKKSRSAKRREDKKTVIKEEMLGQLSLFDLEY